MVNYLHEEKIRNRQLRINLETDDSFGGTLPEQHLARFVVDIIAQLDLGPIYVHYAPQGGEAIPPEAFVRLA